MGSGHAPRLFDLCGERVIDQVVCLSQPVADCHGDFAHNLEGDRPQITSKKVELALVEPVERYVVLRPGMRSSFLAIDQGNLANNGVCSQLCQGDVTFRSLKEDLDCSALDHIGGIPLITFFEENISLLEARRLDRPDKFIELIRSERREQWNTPEKGLKWIRHMHLAGRDALYYEAANKVSVGIRYSPKPSHEAFCQGNIGF